MTADLRPMTYDQLIKIALKEDIGPGDITSNAIIPKEQTAQARIMVKENGTVAGLGIAARVFRQIDRRIKFKPLINDGAQVKRGKVIAVISGPARSILAGERVALNFLQHLSGIATLTSKYRSRVIGPRSYVKILDTRKTIPGLRELEKYAVKAGGGANHRMGLYDAVLIKDNHLKLLGGVSRVLRSLKNKKQIEVEAKTVAQVEAAAKAKVGRVLLDNMSLKYLRMSVKICKRYGVKCEASGGVNLKNIRAIARTGVNYISVGALTHSAPALDISLKIV